MLRIFSAANKCCTRCSGTGLEHLSSDHPMVFYLLPFQCDSQFFSTGSEFRSIPMDHTFSLTCCTCPGSVIKSEQTPMEKTLTSLSSERNYFYIIMVNNKHPILREI
mmetsp:Transcript_609/g.1452  ORF Transcript_609/g.1452 Transcript_609/m.1452 type:complete len:107 (-) Transcript_609:2131-2451(-)